MLPCYHCVTTVLPLVFRWYSLALKPFAKPLQGVQSFNVFMKPIQTHKNSEI